jgi:hypothetical protein
MHSSGSTHTFGDGPTFADDILSDGFFDYRSVPLTVEETLLEVALTWPGPEAIRLLDTLVGRDLGEAQALEVAAAWDGWTCQGDANGTLTWTSPHGHTYTTEPHDYSDHDDEPEPQSEPPPPF